MHPVHPRPHSQVITTLGRNTPNDEEKTVMSRPKIICHMHTLLNGKIDGIANPTDIGMRSQKLYFDLMLGKDRYYA